MKEIRLSMGYSRALSSRTHAGCVCSPLCPSGCWFHPKHQVGRWYQVEDTSSWYNQNWQMPIIPVQHKINLAWSTFIDNARVVEQLLWICLKVFLSVSVLINEEGMCPCRAWSICKCNWSIAVSRDPCVLDKTCR